MIALSRYIKKSRALRAAILFSIAVLFLLGAAYLYTHNPVKFPYFPCIINKLTGFYCPGCGAGRACYSLLHGHIYQAFRYNPLMLPVLVLLAVYAVVRAIDWMLTGGNHIDRYIPDKYLYWLFGVILVYGVIRNIPYFPFNLLAPCQIS